MMPTASDAHLYDQYYYEHGCGSPYKRTPEWLQFFGSLADRIISDLQPTTVLDAGCAMGFLVEALRTRGLEAYGIDISQYAIQNVHPSVSQYCSVGSVADPLPRVYDLIVCIEVLEHLSLREAERAVENLCHHSANILFSSTPLDYRETTHFNVQPPEYWAGLFARHGFFRDLDLNAAFVTPWAAYFRRSGETTHHIVRGYERRFWLLQKENADLRQLVVEMRDQLSAKDLEIQSRGATIAEMQNSESWQLALKLQRTRDHLAPGSGWRGRLMQSFVRKFLGHA